MLTFYLFKKKSSPKDMFIDFLDREEKGKRERNIDWLPLAHTPAGDLTLTQVCDLMGIEPSTFWYMERCSKQLSHLARAACILSRIFLQGVNKKNGSKIFCAEVK